MRLAKPLRSVLVLTGLVSLLLGSATAILSDGREEAFAASAPHCATTPTTSSSAASASGYGLVHFANSCSAPVQPMLELEIARLHSFESAVSRFEAVQRRDPGCAIALWGAAMSARGNPLGGILGQADLETGRHLIDKAIALNTGSSRERALIGAMDVYYRPYPDQTTRARAYADVMDTVRASYPDDPDIAAFDGLAIIEGVDLSDKTYARQKRAGAILEGVMASHPDHPGAPHYLIHAYDYTALAPLAEHAADVYPTLATASSHAQHMPSHIWSMLGEWDKSIRANRASEAILDPAAGRSAVHGDTVYEHAFDFIAYARLQRGDDKHVASDIASLAKEAPVIVRARYDLERGDWQGAANLVLPVSGDPFDLALARFTRAYGAARHGDAARANAELQGLEATRPAVAKAEGEYWGVFVDIYVKAAQAWLAEAQGRNDEALATMTEAAAMDDAHEKHIYLENKILPMRESLADMQDALGHPGDALAAYSASLRLAPNRFRAFAGAAHAATLAGDASAARDWSSKLVALGAPGDKMRPAFKQAQAYLQTVGEGRSTALPR